MAISWIMLTALKAISYANVEVKKTYKAQRALDNLLSKTYKAPIDYKVWDHQVVCGDHNVPVRIFMPENITPKYTLVFFHGGGWVTGNINTYDRICVDIAKYTGQRVVSVDYRLAPEHTFPAATEDCYAVVREIFKLHLQGAVPEDVVLMGDSAGANLAAAVSLMARDREDFIPKQQILIYPAVYNNHTPEGSPFASIKDNGTDYLLTSKRICEYTEMYIKDEADWNSPYFAPLLAKDFSHQPRTLLITAEYCPLRDEGEFYGKKLKEAGADVEIYRIKDAVHGFFSLPYRFSQVKETYKLINQFLKGEDFIGSTEAVEKIG